MMVKHWKLLAALALLLVLSCATDAQTLRIPAEGRTITRLAALRTGGRQTFKLEMPRAESLALKVRFDEAPFNGTHLHAVINGHHLAPYAAFGGDTRYDAVKGKLGMRPPLADIEGRWVLPAAWVRQGGNTLTLWTTGVRQSETLTRLGPTPHIRIASVVIEPLSGARIPEYVNSVYYDFNVWAQGYPWGDEPHRLEYDLALLGVLNGKGMPAIVPPIGAPESALWEVKRACEDYALGWGVRHQEFYTIWEFAGKPQQWATFQDVDHNPETTGPFHDQTLFPNLAPKGADIVLYDTAKYAAALEPAIRMLAPYTDFYNFKCEQNGPRAQGFGVDGERLSAYGIHGDLWARNHFEANKAAHDLVRKYDPEDGRVQEMHHWRQGIRPVLYDTALRRGQPMSDAIDMLMTHFDLMEENDRGPNGLSVKENAFEKQYPYPQAIRPRTGDGTAGNRYPEVALDFNRYRLSRTEQDIRLGDPKVNRWGNGQPFDYRAGFRGDEMMYDSENGVWRTGYAGSSPYQFLHGFFSYSLLPTGAGEPRDLKITVRKSLTETEDLPVRTYGEWVDGVGHTKRLRTIDPLYGDLFGWTGQEYCNFGDYISMVGIKEPHHRRQPNDAFNLVRRTCYAFVTTGPVLPVQVNPGHDDSLFVKALVQTFNHQTYLGLYAANFGTVPATLDATLPVPIAAGTRAIVFDDRAWDWRRSGRPTALPEGADWRYRTQVPGLSAWLVLIPATPEMLAAAYDLSPAPAIISPEPDAAITGDLPTLTWRADPAQTWAVVQVAKEALFRPRDLVAVCRTKEHVADPATFEMIGDKLTPGTRYFWRVAVFHRGEQGLWSTPRAVVYQWPEYSQKFPPQRADTLPVMIWEADLPAKPENLAERGEIWGTGGHMNAPTRAIDGQAFSFWTNGLDEGNSKFKLPAEWAVLWSEPTTLRSIHIAWHEEMPPAEFQVQVSDDAKTWKDLVLGTQPVTQTDIELPAPVTARYFRIRIPRAVKTDGSVGIREVTLTP